LFSQQLIGGQHEQPLVPLSRIKCLMAMTSSRDSRLSLIASACGAPSAAGAGLAATISFVEFSMLSEGFGCLFLPSIAPQLAAPQSLVAMGMVAVSSNASSVNGGVGVGERAFPFASGFTFSTWLCVEKWPSSVSAASLRSPVQPHHHPIRLLTLLKHARLKDTLVTALSVHISTKTRALVHTYIHTVFT
jgi:hypothetical protein